MHQLPRETPFVDHFLWIDDATVDWLLTPRAALILHRSRPAIDLGLNRYARLGYLANMTSPGIIAVEKSDEAIEKVDQD